MTSQILDISKIAAPPPFETIAYGDAKAAVDRLIEIYDTQTAFLREAFSELLAGRVPPTRIRATYPQILLSTTSHAKLDTRLSFGHVTGPGDYAITITRPRLFEQYLIRQLRLLLKNHGVPVLIGPHVFNFAQVTADALAAGAAAGAAWFFDHPAGAMASRTGALDGEKTLLAADFSGALAARTGNRAGAAGRTAALTARTGDGGGDDDRRLFAAKGLFESQFEIVAQIAAAGG